MKRRILFFCSVAFLYVICMSAQTGNKPSFCSLITLLHQIDSIQIDSIQINELPPKATADTAGLTLLNYCYIDGDYSNNDDGNVSPDLIQVVYGQNANYLECERDSHGISKLEKIREHACVLIFTLDSNTYAEIYFSDEEDYKRFMSEAFEYGLLHEKGGEPDVYFIPSKPIKNGGVHIISDDYWQGKDNEVPISYPIYPFIPKGKNSQGWYEYYLPISCY